MAETTTTALNESDIKNLTSAMQQFSKAITDSNKLLLKENKTLQKNAEIINNAQDSIKEQVPLYKKIADSTKNWGEEMKDVLKTSTGISKVFVGGGVAGFFANLVKDTINLDNNITKLSWQMGKGKEGIKDLKKAVNGLQMETGESYEQAVNLVTTLAEEKYVGNIKEAAEGISLFSRATGTSAEAALTLTNTLSKGAGLSDKAINAIYAGMVKVQQSVGISKNGMEALTRTVTNAATSMSAMGKTSADIQKMTNNMTALVGALEQVGISATESTAMLDKLLDPDKIEDNIMLYSQLGISMSDALSGDISLDGMESQLKDMAQKIVDMGPIAGKQFAATMGMTYKQATQMAKMDEGAAKGVADAAQTSEDEAMAQLKKMEDQTDAIFAKAEKGVNKLSGMLRSLPVIIIAMAPLVINKVSKLFKSGFNDIFGKKQMSVTTEGIGSAIALNAEKGLDKSLGLVKKAKNSISGDIEDWFNTKSIGTFFNGVDASIDALYRKAQKKSFIDAFLESGQQKEIDFFNRSLEESSEKIETLKKMASDIGVTFDNDVVANKGFLEENEESLKKNLHITSEQLKALYAINDEIGKQVNGQQGITKELEEYKMKISGLGDKYKAEHDALESSEESLNTAIKLQNKLNTNQEKTVNLATEIAELEQKAKIAKGDVKKILKDQINLKTQELGKAKKATSEAEKEIKSKIETLKLDKENANIQGVINKLTEERNQKQKAYNNLLKEAADKPQSPLKKLLGGIGARAKTFAKTKFGFVSEAYNKSLAESHVAGDSTKGAKRKAIGAAAGAIGKKAGGAALKGVGKALGGIMKSIGPMAIVASLIGKVLDKIKEPMENLIDNLLEFLTPVLNIIVDILGPSLTKIAKGLLPPMLRVLAFILDAARVLLTPIQAILKALAKIPGVGKAFEGVSDILDGITSKETTTALRDAADSISNAGDDLTKSVKKQEEAAEEEKNKPKEITADGAKFIESKGGSATSIEEKPKASEQASSTTSVTKEKKTDEEKTKEAAKDQRDKENHGLIASIADQFDSNQGANQFSIKDLLYLIWQSVSVKPEVITNVTSGAQGLASVEEKVNNN